jgi:Ca2+-binding RTX toxin-like protein
MYSASTADSLSEVAPSVPHSEGPYAAAVTVPDGEFLFQAEFKRSGPDLALTGPDGQRLLIPDYFKQEHLPDLASPDGARLSASVVELLAGPLAPGQYAQATAPVPAAQAIGKVEKVSGSATVLRNGVTVNLNAGDVVYKSDVLQTGSNSVMSVSFSDGTALNLSANTRMVLNEFNYDANSTSNSGLMSLVQGGFAFIAGQVAHTGGLNFDTPVATMGIRGTAGGAACSTATTCQFFAARNVDGSISVYQLIPHAGTTTPLRVEIGTLVQISATAAPVFQPASDLNPAINNLMIQLTQDYPQIIQNLFVPATPAPPTPPTPDPGSTPADPQRSGALGSSNTVAIDLPSTAPPIPTTTLAADTPPSDTPPSPVFVTITVVPPDAPPPPEVVPPLTVANPIANQNSPEDTPWNFVIPGDVFSDPTAAIVVTLGNGDPLDTVGLAFDPATRTVSGTPPQDFNGPIVITVLAAGRIVTDSFTLDVTPVNDAPVAIDDAAATAVDTPVDIVVLANDTDVDGDLLSIFGAPTALHGSVVVNADGSLRYTPSAGYSGEDTISYQVTDGTLVDDGQVTVTTVAGVTIIGTPAGDVIDDSHAPPGQPFATIGHDSIFGLGGNDVIHGGAGNDNINGGVGNDILHGDDGNDSLSGSNGTDQLFGGNGDDRFVVSGTLDTFDSFDGGSGIDTILVATFAPLTLAGFNALQSSIEHWQGNGQGVLGNGNANNFDFSGLQTITGLAFVDAGAGNDILIGSQFADDLRGGANDDLLAGGLGNDTLTGGTGGDTFRFTEMQGGAANFGQDSILDLDLDDDVIEVSSAIFADFADLLAHTADDGLGNAVIDAGAGNTITLHHIAAASLQANHFSFT